jgi:hypothetical protein
MNTPTDKSRRKRRSSVLYHDSPHLFKTSFSSQNGTSLNNTPTDMGKRKKENLKKDLMHKQSIYRSRRLKRDETILRNRNIDLKKTADGNQDQEDQNDLNELDENYYSQFKTENYVGQDLDTATDAGSNRVKEEPFEVITKLEKLERQQEDTNYLTVPAYDEKPPVHKNVIAKKPDEKSNGQSIGNAIINRIASLKNTFKNMVNYGSSSASRQQKQVVQQVIQPKVSFEPRSNVLIF